MFLSGQTREHPIVGPTANIALFADEAQDLDELYFQRAFSPMTASTNAPIIYTGTARHDQTLLAKRRRAAEARERQDGRRRVFVIHWREVEREVPPMARKCAPRSSARARSIPSSAASTRTSKTSRPASCSTRRIALIICHA